MKGSLQPATRFADWQALALLLVCIAADAGSAMAQAADSAALSPELRKFADDCDVLRRGTIIKLEETLRGLRAGQRPTKDKTGEIRQAESDLAALRDRQRVIVPSLRFPVSVGETGRLPSGGAHIEQILGAERMLIRCSFRMQVVVTKHFNQVGEVVNQPVIFQVRGLPTADFSEGSDAEFLQVFHISGRDTYRTADGRLASVLVLQPFDMRPIESYLRTKPEP